MKELLQRCGKVEKEAIETLIRRYRPKSVELASAILKDPHLAEDAVQEAFVFLLTRLGDLRDPSAFWGWFRQIVRTQCTRIIRRRKESLQSEVADTAAQAPSPDAYVEAEDLRRIVRNALSALPDVTRRTAEMFYFEERCCTDIGQELSIPAGTVKRRLHDARRQLRSILLADIPEVMDRRSSISERDSLPL